MSRTLALTLLAFSLGLAACDPFPQVREQDTIEAYEAYLAEHPDSNYAAEAKGRLDELMYEKAKEAKTLEAYDAYLERFPKGLFHDKARKEREAYLWEWALTTHTPEAWDRYMEEYPQFDAKKVRKARKHKKAAEYKDNVGIGALSAEPANLAENPEGPKDGWMFKADITNNGDQTLTYLQITIRFEDGSGTVIGEEKWPVVSSNYGIPVEEEKKVPMKPGETRTWELLTGSVPDGWSQDKGAKLIPTSVSFEEITLSPQ